MKALIIASDFNENIFVVLLNKLHHVQWLIKICSFSYYKFIRGIFRIQRSL